MTRQTRWSALLIAILLTASFWIGACSDDDPGSSPDPTPPAGTVEGTITLLPDDSLMVGVELILMDVTDMTVAAGPVATDDEGYFRMDEVPVGRFYPIPLYDQDLQFDRTDDAVQVMDDQVATLDLRAIRSELWNSEGLKVTGVVRDESTKAPVAGAVVTPMFGDPSWYFQGITLPEEDFTDADGRFELRGVPLDTGPGGLPESTFPIMVTAPGFLPQSFSLDLPGIGEPDSLHKIVDLESGVGTSSISGRVLLAGEPAEGVPVMLDWFDPMGVTKSPEKAPYLGFSTVTDEEGLFRFDGLVAGFYTVAPGYLPDDGYFFYVHSSQAQFELGEDEDFVGEDLILGTLIQPLDPLPGAIVGPDQSGVQWQAVADADSYRVDVAVGHLFFDPVYTQEAQFEFDTPPPAGTDIRWFVEAIKGGDVVGGFDQIHTFRVQEPEEN